MKAVYGAIFTLTQDKKDTYLIEVPALGIMTEGYGMQNAIEMSRDAISMLLISKEDNGELVPESLYNVDVSESSFLNLGPQLVTYIDVDTIEHRRRIDSKSVRRNVTLPNWLNNEAERAHINVSRVLQEALMEKLNIAYK